MNKYVIGIDPGSTKGHGVAVYVNGNLEDLQMMTLFQLYHFLKSIDGSFAVAIEDNVANKRTFGERLNQSGAAIAKTGQNVGFVKWAQLEVERMLDSEFGIQKDQFIAMCMVILDEDGELPFGDEVLHAIGDL